jgi:hypothetical protein
MKIITSLTTTPFRINLFLPTIQSILNQTIPIDSIEINIPYIFKRDDTTYEIPEWLSDLEQSSKDTKCQIKIFRTEDYGAVTKVAPTLIRHKDSKHTYVWSLDDDFIYPENMLAVLYREYSTTNNYVLSHSGGKWLYSDIFKECYSSDRTEGFVDFSEGFASVLYPTCIVKDDFENYIGKTAENLDCRNSDDVIISNYIKLHNNKIYNCSYPYSDSMRLINNGYLPYGYTPDALHQQGGGNSDRYKRVLNWLKTQNLNAWAK